MHTTAIDADKAELRRKMVAVRDALAAETRQAAAQTIAERPFPVPFKPGAIVSGFFAIRSEINPLPLMRKLAAQGAGLALPVMIARGQPLIMRAFAFGDQLAAGQWGIREPTAEAAEVAPDIVLTPLLAFDRRGHRIGYGAGYYDMTLARLRAQKTVTVVGLAYAMQEVMHVPVTERDVPLDLVLTEREAIDCRQG